MTENPTMGGDPILKAITRATRPQSLRRRMTVGPVISAVSLTILVPFLGLAFHEVAPLDGPPILGWKLGVGMWLASVLLIPVYSSRAPKVERARTAYALTSLGILPFVIGVADGALRFGFGLLGPPMGLIVAAGLVLGLGTLPAIIKARRMRDSEALTRGYLRRALNKEVGTWDPQYDNDDPKDQALLDNPGCLMRLVPWIGPATGMSLDELFGRAGANQLIAYLAISLGYGFLYFWIASTGARLLGFRKIETELGRPIMLAEEPVGR
jgi:hypothetical protein